MEKYVLNLKDFKKIQKLGKGGFGEVFLVENVNTNKQYAVKVSIKDSSNHEDQIIFFNEVDKLIKLKNPAILGFIGFSLSNFSSEPYPSIIINYMPNGSLDELLDKSRHLLSPHEWTDTKKYINLLGIALGMKYLHSQNIVQRDLKPSNILLDENFYPHISDFGFSKQLDELNSKNLMTSGVGTIVYNAPEILTGNDYNYKVDVYAYSLIAYEIITSNRPFSDIKNAYQFIREIPEGKRPDTSMISNESQLNLLKKCWSNNSKERPKFSEIIDILKSKNFISNFDVDLDEVNDYIELFKDEKLISNEDEANTEKVEKSIPTYIVKLVFIGDFNVGKTSIINSFIYSNKGKKYEPTVCIDFYVQKIHTDLGDCNVQIFDTSGIENFHHLIPSYIRDANGIVIVIDANIEGQFESLQKYFQLCQINRNNPSVYIAVKNCIDGCIIDMKTIETFANQNDCCIIPFAIEDTESINSLFNKIILDLIRKGNTIKPNDINVTIQVRKDFESSQNNKICLIY